MLTVHDLTSLALPGQNRRGWISHKLIGRRVCANADRIICISESARQDLLRFHRLPEDRIRVVHNGLSPHFSPPAPEAVAKLRQKLTDGRPFLLFLGVLQPRKNIPALITAYARSREAGLTLPLVVAGGRGWGDQVIFDRVKELGLTEHVHFTGRIPDEELPLLYGSAEVFVFPSLYEGFGWPPLEAMACGTPVICSNASSLPEVVGDAAVLIDPRDTAGLAHALLRVAGDKSLREQLRSRGLQRAAQFSWKRCADEVWRVYEEIL